MIEERIEFENRGGKIIGLLESPEIKTKTNDLILLAHGFTGSMDGPSSLYKRLAGKLVESGFTVYRFNFRFTSNPFEEHHRMTLAGEVDDLKLLIREFSKKYGKIGVVGESMGGAVSILGYSPKVECLVLYYPAIFLKENIRTMWSSDEKVRELREKGVLSYVKRSTNQTLYIGKNFVEGVNAIDTLLPEVIRIKCPVLFIHGNTDRTVSFTESERAFKAANEPKKIEIIDGAEHGFKDENYQPCAELQDRAINLTIGWFKKWLV